MQQKTATLTRKLRLPSPFHCFIDFQSIFLLISLFFSCYYETRRGRRKIPIPQKSEKETRTDITDTKDWALSIIQTRDLMNILLYFDQYSIK